MMKLCVSVFFFQAEDGIRDVAVTGVQTCALPISELRLNVSGCSGFHSGSSKRVASRAARGKVSRRRSEERRVGKSVDLGGRRIVKKKKHRIIRVRYTMHRDLRG